MNTQLQQNVRTHLKNGFVGENDGFRREAAAAGTMRTDRYAESREGGRAEIRRLQPKCIFEMGSNQHGIALLLMVVLLSTFLSISIGIVNILLGQIFIVGQAGESFKAFYATDIGMERTLYRDRVQKICGGGCTETRTLIPENACYTSVLTVGPSIACPAPKTRCIVVTAQDKCGAGITRYVVRRFEVKY